MDEWLHKKDNYCAWIDQIHENILLLRSWLYLFCEKHQLHNLCSLFKFDFCLEKTKNCKYSIDTLAYNKHNYLLKFKPFYLNYWSCSPVSKINFVFEQLQHLNYLFKLIWCVVENSEVLLDRIIIFFQIKLIKITHFWVSYPFMYYKHSNHVTSCTTKIVSS